MSERSLQPKVRYVLHPDLRIISYDDLSEQKRTQTGIEKTESIITKKGGRHPSKKITEEMAQFLRHFETPVTYVEAVSGFSRATDKNADEVLEEAFPFVEQLIHAQFIVLDDGVQIMSLKPTMDDGTIIGDLKVLKALQVYEDTEVYCVESLSSRNKFALKILRSLDDKKAEKGLIREVEVLKSLDGVHNPAYGTDGMHAGRFFLTMSWVDFPHARAAFQGINYGTRDEKIKLMDLCLSILKALWGLHQQHVLHGDIHYKNIHVNPETMESRILDFGRSVLTNIEERKSGRAGIAYFFEPEHAAEVLRGRSKGSSEKGEQFSAAAVLYYLIAGQHYCDFSLEKEIMMEQISKAPVRKFSELNKPEWPEMEAILRKALSTDPASRYENIGHMIADLQVARNLVKDGVADRSGDYSSPYYNDLMTYLDSPQGGAFETLHKAPLSSVVFGASGIAYALYRLSCLEGSSERLFTADLWLSKALGLRDQKQSIHYDSLGLTAEIVPEASFYYGYAGLYAVQCLIAFAMGDEATFGRALQSYVRVCESAGEREPLEINMGLAGLLLGCCLIIEHTNTSSPELNQAGDNLYKKLLARVPEEKMSYLGIAHGKAGIHLAMMRWSAIGKRPLHEFNVREIDALLERRVDYNGYKILPVTRKSKTPKFEPWWCNGATGMIHFWLEAYGQTGNDECLRAAQESGRFVIGCASEGFIRDLCCGYAGWAYGLLALYQVTGDEQWLDGTQKIIKLLRMDTSNMPFTFSFYKGAVGAALLLEEMKTPLLARMPLFASVR